MAQAALYHAKRVRAEATFEVVLRAGSSPSGAAVAAGAGKAAGARARGVAAHIAGAG